ncbi:hypothetical protein KSP39_PZI019512 [Platanthera zijinensis]|uniref:Uncharacterized protein n=1 Tax=Platanthera zijinensis TaxID=2320716 RepID=A0AAP0B1W1_9ASPA
MLQQRRSPLLNEGLHGEGRSRQLLVMLLGFVSSISILLPAIFLLIWFGAPSLTFRPTILRGRKD